MRMKLTPFLILLISIFVIVLLSCTPAHGEGGLVAVGEVNDNAHSTAPTTSNPKRTTFVPTHEWQEIDSDTGKG